MKHIGLMGAALCAFLLVTVSLFLALLYPIPTVEPDGWDLMIVNLHKTLPHNKPPPVKVSRSVSLDEYLCEVYKRTPVKADAAGDFTWKDAAAAKRMKMELCEYTIGGMSPELKKRLEAFGKKADSMKIEWSLLSGFRDDYRQRIASGLKASEKNSMHGGSHATRGYGDGRAVDITVASGPLKPLLDLVDTFGKSVGLGRPYVGFDPQHVQLMDPQYARTKVVRHEKKRIHNRRIQTASAGSHSGDDWTRDRVSRR